MKKLFVVLLVLELLFLTACSNTATGSTIGTGMSNSVTSEKPNELELKDTIINNKTEDFIALPSRIIYTESASSYVYYYSKADGKAYVYCFDPLCEHNDGSCLADPFSLKAPGWSFLNTLFINNRFYIAATSGQVISFAFDGSDMKIEYDAEYDSKMINQVGWSLNAVAYGSYIYINQRKDENGNPNTLRFNTETGEMENLTAKTGNYILPIFFYNGEIYGRDVNMLWAKSDIDVNHCEAIEEIPFSSYSFGSCFFGIANDDNWNEIGIEIYDMKTGETKILTNEMLGIEHAPSIVGVDEDYIYFYQQEQIEVGKYLNKDQLKTKYKWNNGSLYRVNHDGTGLVCIYEEDEFEITGYEIVISGDQILIKGQNIRVHDNQVEMWDKGLLVGTIGADGKIDSLDPVEVIE